MYKFTFFVPSEFAEPVKLAVFKAGAGEIGNYRECCWEAEGVGQFKPMHGSEPFIGESGTLERVTELKVEMVCKEDLMAAVIKAFKQAHPYEEPAYEVFKLEDF